MALGERALAAYEAQQAAKAAEREAWQQQDDIDAISQIVRTLGLGNTGTRDPVEAVTVRRDSIEHRLYLVDDLAFEVVGPHDRFIYGTASQPGIYFYLANVGRRWCNEPITSLEVLGKQISEYERERELNIALPEIQAFAKRSET